ncbi:hypothetical protein [Butyrivibrio virus Ceridwen]|nr:hypothetical protein [Butyrivibrio virus Ceridwen]
MALTDENSNGMVMPVAPMGGGNGFGNFGGDGWWILLLFLLIGGNGWGGFGGYGGGNELYPWMNQSNQINDGFRDQMINSNVTEIRNGVTGLATQMCNGFAGVEQGANARQIANMQQNFANQTAVTGAISDLASQQASCCCESRLATCQTQNIVQNEGNATRFADANNTRDIIDSQTRGTQAILDKLCALELDGVKGQLAQAQRENIALQNQINMGALRESQTAQNAFISQGFANEVDALYNRLSNCPVPSTPVYGRTPIFTCNQTPNCGCGCGMN